MDGVLKRYGYSSTTQYLLNTVTDEMTLQEIFSLISGFKRVYQKEFHTGK